MKISSPKAKNMVIFLNLITIMSSMPMDSEVKKIVNIFKSDSEIKSLIELGNAFEKNLLKDFQVILS